MTKTPNRLLWLVKDFAKPGRKDASEMRIDHWDRLFWTNRDPLMISRRLDDLLLKLMVFVF